MLTEAVAFATAFFICGLLHVTMYSGAFIKRNAYASNRAGNVMIDGTKNDNWGASARVGIFIVGNEAVPEAEWWAMAPPHTSVHAARVTASAPWAGWNANRTAVELAADVQRGAKQFSSMQLSAVVVGHSSSSFLGGKGWDEAVIERLTDTLGENIFITTNGLDCLAALRASGIHRPLVVFPAWFGPKIIAAGEQYFSELGVAPAATLSFDPGSQWRGVAPGSMYAKGFGFEQEIEPLYQQIINACDSSVDGVLVVGTGFRSVAIIERLEYSINVPVITANQASLWHCLRRAGVGAKVAGYGRLFTQC